MRFTEYKYLWPPRPDKAIPINLLGYYEQQGWIAQIKKNGQCIVLYVTPKKKLIAKTRQDSDPKVWTPDAQFAEQFKHLWGTYWYVFVGEWLHMSKVLYLFDVLVARSTYLVGMPLEKRLKGLHGLFPKAADSITDGYYVASTALYITVPLKHNFKQTFLDLQATEDEGLVLKDPKAELQLCLDQKSNSKWQVKCRKPTKKYTF